MNHCLRHLEEPSTGECRSCHGTFCARCLVYSFGPKKPPFCVGCALVASGVRPGQRPTYQPPMAATAQAVATFEAAPALFDDETHRGGPGQPPTSGSSGLKSAKPKLSWSQRRAQRQAARRSAQEVAKAGSTDTAKTETQHLEPLLSPTERQALGRLSASNF